MLLQKPNCIGVSRVERSGVQGAEACGWGQRRSHTPPPWWLGLSLFMHRGQCYMYRKGLHMEMHNNFWPLPATFGPWADVCSFMEPTVSGATKATVLCTYSHWFNTRHAP